jgi:DinB superfamily
MTHATIIKRLEELPDEIALAARALEPESGTRPSEQGWSPMQILGHLEYAAGVYRQRIDRVVAEDSPFLPSYDQDEQVRGRDVSSEKPADMVAALRQERVGMVQTLRGLDEAGWRRAGTHEEEGRVTVEWLAQHVVDHEEEHLRDLRAVSKQ